MDLGIAGKKALVCASSQGLGLACATALAQEGVEVWLNARNADKLETAAKALGASVTSKVHHVVADITTKEGRAALIAACPDADILVNNNAGPDPLAFQEIDEDIWIEALKGNMIAPLMLIKAVLPGMRARKFGRIINITSAMVTTPRPHMALSSAARGGLTVAAKGQSLAVVKDNVTINNLLPERIDTDRQVQMAKAQAKRENITYEQARAKQPESIAAKRLGRPEEFGATCAFLCSQYAGYISGMNIHLDGGSYPAVI